MGEACITLYSITHLLFGAALYAALTWLPGFSNVSIAITFFVAVIWEFIEIAAERHASKNSAWGSILFDEKGRSESLCNRVMDVLLALGGHLLLSASTRSAPRLPIPFVTLLWVVWLASLLAVMFEMRRRRREADSVARKSRLGGAKKARAAPAQRQ